MTDQIPAEAIEAASRAIQSAHVPVTGEAMPDWESESEAWRKTYRDFARAALSAALPFLRPEPSEDDREALANLIPLDLVHDRGRPDFPQNAFEAADRILAAGFTRRPMPSPDEVCSALWEVTGIPGVPWKDAHAEDRYPVEVSADAVLALFEGGEG